MKILIAPLNWGLGHATRSIPIIRHYLAKGDEVVLGGDGESILLLKQAFPDLRVIDLPSLELRYTSDPKQRGFYFRAVGALIRFTIADHYYLRKALAIEHFDLIISDNRFGFFSRQVRSVYITHQIRKRLWQNWTEDFWTGKRRNMNFLSLNPAPIFWYMKYPIFWYRKSL